MRISCRRENNLMQNGEGSYREECSLYGEARYPACLPSDEDMSQLENAPLTEVPDEGWI